MTEQSIAISPSRWDRFPQLSKASLPNEVFNPQPALFAISPPSAPPWPAVAPSWWHNAALLRPFGKSAVGTGVTGLGLCICFGQRLQRLSNSLLQGSRLISTGLAATGTWLFFKNYWQDPQYCREQYEKAERIIRDESLSLQAIDSRFGSLRSTVLTNERLYTLLLEIEGNCKGLISKHGVHIASILTPSDRDNLKKRFLNECAHEDLTDESLYPFQVFESRYQTAISALAISDEDEEYFFACRAALDVTIGYETFRQLYPAPLDRYPADILAWLRAKYLCLSYPDMVKHETDRAFLSIDGNQIRRAMHERVIEEGYSLGTLQRDEGDGPLKDKMLYRETVQILYLRGDTITVDGLKRLPAKFFHPDILNPSTPQIQRLVQHAFQDGPCSNADVQYLSDRNFIPESLKKANTQALDRLKVLEKEFETRKHQPMASDSYLLDRKQVIDGFKATVKSTYESGIG